MDFEEYVSYDGIGLAEIISAGEVSEEEVRQAALSAVARRNPGLNAVLTTLEDESEAELGDGLPEGPFKGVPFLIKEVVLQARGAPCRFGSRGFPDVPCPADSELMARFRRAGLLLVGTTQTPEFAYNATTEPVAFGPVHNPWRAGYSAGGSSGGSGAAVAAGMVPVAHANDAGGSIRGPAAHCGVVGLKPTRDRTPAGPGVAGPLLGHGIEFAISRSVRDSAALLDSVAGPDRGAPHIIAPPSQPFADFLSTPPRPQRIAVMTTSFFGTDSHDECQQAVARTTAMLEDLGHQIVDPPQLQLSWDEYLHHIHITACTFIASGVDALTKATGRPANAASFEATTLACAEYGRTVSALELLAAIEYFNTLSRSVAGYFEPIDILLTPTASSPPPEHGVLDQNRQDITAMQWTEQVFSYVSFAAVYNSTGQPAISVPTHWSPDNLPIGVQLAGHIGDEGTLLGVAAQLESASNWRDRQQVLMTAS